MAVNVEKWLVIEDVENAVALVTGGAAGVGAAVVRTLLSQNAGHVAFLDIAEREGAALETELLHKFGALKAKFIKCDISDEEQLAAAYQQVFDKYRRLDVVVNNAAVLSADEAYKKMVDINFTATVSSTFKALDIMGAKGAKSAGGGVVVNISSLLALQHKSRLPVYTATKTAVLQFSSSIGAQYEKTRVRVVTVCLGPTDTAILQKQNLVNFNKDSARSLTSRVPERQRVDSAATGIVEVIKRGTSGSIWRVANNEPATNISDNIQDGFDVFSEGLEHVYSCSLGHSRLHRQL